MNHFVYLYTQGVALPASLPADPSFSRVFDYVSDADEAPAFRKVPYATVFLDAAAQFVPESVATPEPREIPPSLAQPGRECFVVEKAEDVMKAHMYQGLLMRGSAIPAMKKFSVSAFPRLLRIVIGNGVAPNCALFQVKRMPELRSIYVGEDSFTTSSRCDAKNAIVLQDAIRKTPKVFEVAESPALEEITIGNGSFADFTQCTLRDLPRLHELTIGSARPEDGYENRSYAFVASEALELRELVALETVEIGNYAFYYAQKMVLEGRSDGGA